MNLSQQALDHFGELNQLDKAQEELGELITALARWRANRSVENAIAVIDEIADVMIIADQLRELFGPWEVDMQKEFKQKRLADRIGCG